MYVCSCVTPQLPWWLPQCLLLHPQQQENSSPLVCLVPPWKCQTHRKSALKSSKLHPTPQKMEKRKEWMSLLLFLRGLHTHPKQISGKSGTIYWSPSKTPTQSPTRAEQGKIKFQQFSVKSWPVTSLAPGATETRSERSSQGGTDVRQRGWSTMSNQHKHPYIIPVWEWVGSWVQNGNSKIYINMGVIHIKTVYAWGKNLQIWNAWTKATEELQPKEMKKPLCSKKWANNNPNLGVTGWQTLKIFKTNNLFLNDKTIQQQQKNKGKNLMNVSQRKRKLRNRLKYLKNTVLKTNFKTVTSLTNRMT